MEKADMQRESQKRSKCSDQDIQGTQTKAKIKGSWDFSGGLSGKESAFQCRG